MGRALKWSSVALLVVVPGIQFVPSPVEVVVGESGASGTSTIEAAVATSLPVSRISAKAGRAGRSRTARAVRRVTRPEATVDPEVGPIVQRACKDCHSNETEWPWYGRVAPVSWIVANDVKKGREKLNFSTWASRKPTANELQEICDAATNGTMPPRGYRLVHAEAALQEHDIDVLCDWADTARSLQQKFADTGRRATR